MIEGSNPAELEDERPLSEPLHDPAAAAASLRVRRSWVYEAVRDGRLPHVKVGRHVRFLRSGLERCVRPAARAVVLGEGEIGGSGRRAGGEDVVAALEAVDQTVAAQGVEAIDRGQFESSWSVRAQTIRVGSPIVRGTNGRFANYEAVPTRAPVELSATDRLRLTREASGCSPAMAGYAVKRPSRSTRSPAGWASTLTLRRSRPSSRTYGATS